MLDLADIWARRTGNEVRLVSANDHLHAPTSMHYDGHALDLISNAPDALAEAMRGLGYRVLWRVPGHFGHVHVEIADATAPVVVTAPSPPPASRPAPKRSAAGGS
jgi:hypothetical protein